MKSDFCFYDFLFCFFLLDDIRRDPLHQKKHQQFSKTAQKEAKEERTLFSGSKQNDIVLTNDLVSRRPTVNQSFIDKIVAEIEAKNSSMLKPLPANNQSTIDDIDSIEGKNKTSLNPLQKLIDRVADSVVKEVTTELKGVEYKPSRRVVVPKPPILASKRKAFPLLDDEMSATLGSRAPELSQSSLRDDDDRNPPRENIQPTYLPLSKESLSSKQTLWGDDQYRGINPERQGLDEIRNLLKSMNRSRARSKFKTENSFRHKGRSKSRAQSRTRSKKKSNHKSKSRSYSKSEHVSRPKAHVKSRTRSRSRQRSKSKNRLRHKSYLQPKRPITESARKKLTIPATTEGRKTYCSVVYI